MVQNKWYPTAVVLGGEKILIASGKTNDGDMEIFNEATETFSTMTGDDKIFPNLYPGLHILPNNSIFYSRTGFGNAGANPGGQSFPAPVANPNRLGGLRSAFFTPNAIPNATPTGGLWTEIIQIQMVTLWVNYFSCGCFVCFLGHDGCTNYFGN